MKKSVIAVWGASNQGKSETIKRIAKLLLTKPKAILHPDFPLAEKGDIFIIIIINHIKVGITSQGDPNTNLKDRLKILSKYSCDIIICATRTSGETVNVVSDMNKTYDIIWATNYRSKEKNTPDLNQLSAKQICELMDELISARIG